jgi:hypothetical protein
MKFFSEPHRSRKVSVGDVISSVDFIVGLREGHALWVGGSSNSQSEIDPSRATSKYVVISAEQTQFPDFATRPDGWLVIARKLNEQDLDDGHGEVIYFNQYFTDCGSASYGVVREVNVLAKMAQRFI